MKLLLTIKEASESVSMSEAKIRRMVADGRFPRPVAIGGNVRWRGTDLEAWVDNMEAGAIYPAKTRRGRPRLAI